MAENRIVTRIGNAYRVFKWLEAVVCIWFLRLFAPIALAWGLWDVWWYTQGDTSEQRADDAAIRMFAGTALALCWLFLARRKGPWTLNKNGILERWPWAEEQAGQLATALELRLKQDRISADSADRAPPST